MIHWRRAAFVAIATALTACGGSADSGYNNAPTSNPTTPTTPGPTSPGVATNSVTLTDATFDPTNIVVNVGATVTWQWNSCSDSYGGYSTCVTHQIAFDDGSGIMSSMQSAGTFTRVFNTAGTYKYHCTVHGAPMSGQVTVQ